jgi:hypothetical protein
MDDDSEIQAFGDCSEGDYRKLCLLDPAYSDMDCPVVACPDFYEWDDFESKCVAISCEAEGACADNETCVPDDVQCTRSPCPQFVCEDAQTDEEDVQTDEEDAETDEEDTQMGEEDTETDEEETCDPTLFLKGLCK